MYRFSSDRVGFRKLSEDDVTQAYPDALNDPEICKYLETRHTKQTIDTCKKFIVDCNLNPSEELYGMYLLSNNHHLGNIKINCSWIYKVGTISIVLLDKNYFGKGYGFEVLKRMTEFGFSDLKLEKIEAGCISQNIASISIFTKVGYVQEGDIRSSIILDNHRTNYILLGITKSELT